MKRSPPGTIDSRLLSITFAAILLALGIVAWRAAPRVRELDWLRDLERADGAAATERPARYRGKLRGPPGRTTPAGTRAAAFWWGVVHRDDEGEDVRCQGRERSDLWLETGTGKIRIAFAEADPAVVGLVTDVKSNEYDHRIAFDLGSTERSVNATLPAGTCEGEGARYEELLISDGAAVEVVGCMKGGALGECEGPLAAVLSVPDIEVHRRHRIEKAENALRVALGACLALLLTAGWVILRIAADTLRVLRPGKGA